MAGVCLRQPIPSCAPPRLSGSYLVVELTNRCSLACVHCSVSEKGHPHHATSGYLSPVLFDELVDDLVDRGARFDALILFWLGEPLLHPHFSRLYRRALRAAVHHGTFGKIEVHSNATHLTAPRIAGLLNDAAVPQVLHLSLDAIRRDTYLAVKGMDRFDKVQHNVAEMLVAKGRTRARWPRVVLQYIVGSNNVAEVGEYRRHWEQTAKQAGVPVRSVAGHVPQGEDTIVFFRQLDCPTAALQEQENRVFREEMARQGLSLPDEARKGQLVEADNPQPCSGFWKSPVVSWEGDVTVCTRDNELLNGIGRLGESRFSALWWGPQMRQRRRQVAEGNYAGLSLCSTCFIPRSLNHAELSADDIARQAAHDLAQEVSDAEA